MPVQTQHITAVDIENGRIRLPHAAKSLFPNGVAHVDVSLLGHVLTNVAYDPRYGPDRERSAVLRVGKSALASIPPGTVLGVTRNASGMICIDR